MAAFFDCCKVETESFEILRKSGILDALVSQMGGAPGGWERITDKSQQAFLGDVSVPQSNGDIKYIEIKSEVRHTGNLFIETWSNFSREDERDICDKRKWDTPPLPFIMKRDRPEEFETLMSGKNSGIIAKIGWFDKLANTDTLIYHFLDRNRIYIVNWKRLQSWLREPIEGDPDNRLRMQTIWHAPMGKQIHKQKNRTWGLIVKIEDIMQTPGLIGSIDILHKTAKEVMSDVA